MDERRGRRARLRSVAIGGVLGAAGAIATVRRIRRSHTARSVAGLFAFESAPCFAELHDHDSDAEPAEGGAG
jgi:hypothetical protein